MTEPSLRAVDRRAFLAFCATMAATLALPESYVPAIAKALTAASGRFSYGSSSKTARGAPNRSCARESPVGQLVLETLSIDYHEMLMAAAGGSATRS